MQWPAHKAQSQCYKFNNILRVRQISSSGTAGESFSFDRYLSGRCLKPIIFPQAVAGLYFLSPGLIWRHARRIWSPIFFWQTAYSSTTWLWTVSALTKTLMTTRGHFNPVSCLRFTPFGPDPQPGAHELRTTHPTGNFGHLRIVQKQRDFLPLT